MNSENVCVGSRSRREKTVRRRNSIRQQLVVNQTIFLRWKNVSAQIQIVSMVVNELEWQHDSPRLPRSFYKLNCLNTVCAKRNASCALHLRCAIMATHDAPRPSHS